MISGGVVYPVKSPSTDVPEVIYENGTLGAPAAFFTGSLPRAHLMDEISFAPGPAAGSPALITSTVFPIGMTTPTLPFDAIAVRYRVWDTVMPAATPVTSDLRGDVTFIFEAPLAGWALNTYYVSNPIDLTGLPGGGIQTSDDAIALDLLFLTTMIDPVTQQPVPTTTHHPDATGVFADLLVGPVQTVGSSTPTFWRDVNDNGEFSPDELRQFTAPAVGNFILELTGEVGGGGPTCYANCDGSTQPPILNVADFGCFLTKFAAGDLYANCDDSTQPPVLNVADFGCFLTKFAAGCP